MPQIFSFSDVSEFRPSQLIPITIFLATWGDQLTLNYEKAAPPLILYTTNTVQHCKRDGINSDQHLDVLICPGNPRGENV